MSSAKPFSNAGWAPNYRAALDAAIALLLHSECHQRRASERGYVRPLDHAVHTPHAISHRMQRILERELRSGERVVWSQQPRPATMARKSSSTFLFGIPFFAFAVIWTYGASGGFESSRTHKASWPQWFPLLWGGMFMVAGAWLLLSPLWAYWKALRTVYAITDQRAILIVAPWRRTIHSFVGQHLVDIHRVESDDGRGDIIFHREARSGKRGDYYYDVGFLGIDRVREVEDSLRQLYDQTRAA